MVHACRIGDWPKSHPGFNGNLSLRPIVYQHCAHLLPERLIEPLTKALSKITSIPPPARALTDTRWVPALTASVLLHALVLGVLATVRVDRPEPMAQAESLGFQRFSVVPRLYPPPPDPAEPPVPLDEEIRTPAAAASSQSFEGASEERTAPVIKPPQAAAIDPTPAADPTLRERLLQQIEQHATPKISTAPGPEAALTGRSIPHLPSSRGWLSGHVGTVAAQVDSWREPDGSQRAQVTLADGTVICMQRRAPTVEEFMQPWKSTIVTMSRICGRARPEPVDYSDPRVQPPPRVTHDEN